MTLSDHIKARGLTYVEAARELAMDGVNPSATLRRWALGSMRPDADVIERIAHWSGGAVTARDMHETRLEWLRENRPERFGDGDAVPCGAPLPGDNDRAGAPAHGNPVANFFLRRLGFGRTGVAR